VQLSWASVAALTAGVAAFLQAWRGSSSGERAARVAVQQPSAAPLPAQVTRPLYEPPSQLPPDIGDFTGRDARVAEIKRILLDRRHRQATALRIVTIAGKGGIGKTALMVHVAHQLKHAFPDGQLFVDLRGFEPQALHPIDVLADFLRALGAEGQSIPQGADERVRMFRSRIAGHAVLVVLDNAANEAQVRPLLPGAATCAVLVTSRSPLAGLEGTTPIVLDVLEPEPALELLRKLAGRKRVDDELQAAARIVEFCGYLPLAVRIAGARLAARQHWKLDRFLERLAVERNRLSELHAGDLDVRSTFTLSYTGLGHEERRAFRLLGLLNAKDFPAWTLAALMDSGIARAEGLLERLVDAQLLDVAKEDPTGTLRYEFHDLLRALARERLEEEPAAERAIALERLVGGYVALATGAEELFQPGELRKRGAALRWSPGDLATTTLLGDPVEWLTTERPSLLAAIDQAFEAGLWEATWELAHALAPFFEMRAHWNEWERTHALALEASRRSGNHLAEAVVLYDLGALDRDRGNTGGAIDKYAWAADRFQEIGDEHGEAIAYLGLGIVYRNQGRWEKAAFQLNTSLATLKRLGDRRLAAQAMRSLAIVMGAQRDLDASIAKFQQSIRVFQELGDRRAEAYNWRGLGEAQLRQGEWEHAISSYEASLAMVRALRDRRGEARALQGLGRVKSAQAALAEALRYFEEALEIARVVGDGVLEAEILRDIAARHEKPISPESNQDDRTVPTEQP
jgi:tetratricopeptide (TPR) repeat protein